METSPLLEQFKTNVSIKQVMKMEEKILQKLDWDVANVVSFDVVETLMSIGVLFEDDRF